MRNSRVSEKVNFINQVIGKSFDIEAVNGFNCYTLFQLTQSTLYGRHMPDMHEQFTADLRALAKIIRQRDHLHWEAIPEPVDGSLVELAHRNHPHHIGTYIDVDGGKVLHAMGGAGICFDSLLVLKATGWRRFIYYDWRS